MFNYFLTTRFVHFIFIKTRKWKSKTKIKKINHIYDLHENKKTHTCTVFTLKKRKFNWGQKSGIRIHKFLICVHHWCLFNELRYNQRFLPRIEKTWLYMRAIIIVRHSRFMKTACAETGEIQLVKLVEGCAQKLKRSTFLFN